MSEPKRSLPPCPRCKGKMLPDKSTTDTVCFNCGNILYAAEIIGMEDRRAPSHAGQLLN